MKIFYLVYKLTNSVNSKIYIGCHMTKNLDDGYMGSGTILKYAKKKYGIENFKKEILSTHETPAEMLAEEARIVNEEFLGREDVYNLTRGGRGSWFYTNQILTKEQRTKAGNAGGFANANSLSIESKNKIFQGNQKGGLNGFFVTNKYHEVMIQARKKATIAGHTPIANARRKIALSLIDHQKGEKNSQFGTKWHWINNNVIVRKIKKEDLAIWIDQGWKQGRKLTQSPCTLIGNREHP